MPALELTDEQVVALVRQLPPERRRAALLALAAGASEQPQARMKCADNQLRRICAERGLDWDKLPEDQREALVEELAHEDRPCRP